MRVLIADDHAVVRRGLMEILEEEFPAATFGEAADTPEALQQIRKHKWDVVVLDITMPGGSGLDVLRDSRSLHPNLPVLVLSMHPEEQYALRALKAGAAGYLTKETAPEELVAAIKTVLAGRKYVSASLAQDLAWRLEADSERPIHEALSDREHEVMLMIASGKTVSQVAEELSLSVKTVSTYRARILSKMGMKTNADLTRYAMENKLLD